MVIIMKVYFTVLFLNLLDDIVEKHLYQGTQQRNISTDPYTGEAMATVHEIPFFTRQKKISLRNVGTIDPLNIDEYIAFNGYFALGRVVTRFTPKETIEIIKRSGLRGRGGAGFPAGLKWEFTAEAQGTPKYVVCNADEGDPGAFMDRSIIEGDPHTLIEGMAIAGYAVGANQGMSIRRVSDGSEAPENAIRQAREYGLLGSNTGTGFDLTETGRSRSICMRGRDCASGIG